MTLQQPEELQFTVGAQRLEVMFKDGTAVTLHPVFDNGAPVTHHRALKLPKGVTIVVDLRKMVPQIADDLRVAPPKDVVGIVFFSLRLKFASAELFTHEAIRFGRVVAQETRVAA